MALFQTHKADSSLGITPKVVSVSTHITHTNEMAFTLRLLRVPLPEAAAERTVYLAPWGGEPGNWSPSVSSQAAQKSSQCSI